MRDDVKTVKEIAKEWGVTLRSVQIMCISGKIPGARKIGKIWVVPRDAVRPVDNRKTKGASDDKPEKTTQPSAAKKRKSRARNQKTLSLLSHNIRTSLHSIMGYSDMIRNHIDNKAKTLEYIEAIQQSGKTILNLTDNLIEIQRILNGDEQRNDQKENIKRMVENVVEELAPEAKKNNVQIITTYELKNDFFMIDQSKETKILRNILENAVTYSKVDGIVEINIKEEPSEKKECSRITYVIKDNGIGMSEHLLSHIFDVYSAEYDEDEQDSFSQGFGMPMTKLLVELLGGTVNVESHLDFGTKVTVSLKHDIAENDEIADELKMVYTEEFFRGKRILLVEDNAINRDIAESILTEKGMLVESAKDGIMCLSMLDSQPAGYYDYILMDLQMPNMNGFTATMVIRGLEDHKKAGVPIIAMTASVLNTERERAIKSGMNGFVEKPLEIKRLLKTMGDCTDRVKA